MSSIDDEESGHLRWLYADPEVSNSCFSIFAIGNRRSRRSTLKGLVTCTSFRLIQRFLTRVLVFSRFETEVVDRR